MNQKLIRIDNSNKKFVVKKDTQYIGLYIGRKEETSKSSIKFKIADPKIKLEVIIRAIIFDSANFDFEGTIVINRGARKAEANMKINALTIGEKAIVKVVPNIEIFENDVKCSHGATVGKIDEKQKEYLGSRGLNKIRAEKLIVQGYIDDIVNMIKCEDGKMKFQKLLIN